MKPKFYQVKVNDDLEQYRALNKWDVKLEYNLTHKIQISVNDIKEVERLDRAYNVWDLTGSEVTK